MFIAWAGRISAGTPSPGPEALEVGFFPPDELPDLPFPHDPAIIEAWLRARGEEGTVTRANAFGTAHLGAYSNGTIRI